MEYATVQQIAKDTICYMKDILRPGMTLPEVRTLCERRMLAAGIDAFWYWDIGAFCFAGDETIISVSGRTYKTSNRTIAENDIITIDLSPQIDDIWGDYARTIVIEHGHIVRSIDAIEHAEWRNGLRMEAQLHKELLRFATPHTTFEELYLHMNRYIRDNGYQNLDFAGNLGHSIVKRKEDRVYTEAGNQQKLSDVGMFTFEPHITIPGSQYGYKQEDIYHFKDGKLTVL